MAPRDPNRPAAKDISDEAMLSACDDYAYARGPFPTQPFLDTFPKNVCAAKLAKLERRGLVDARRYLTRAGVAELKRLREEVA